MIGIFQAIQAGLSVVSAPITEWLKGRAAVAKTRAEGKVKIAEAQIVGQARAAEQNADYNTEAMRQMQFSWKDVVLMLIFMYPFVLSFTAPFVDIWLEDHYKIMPHIDEAWRAVGLAPDWYTWAVLGIVVATFGLKGWGMKQTLVGGK